MDAHQIIKDMSSCGFTLTAENGKLLVKPGSRLTDADRAVIRENKSQILRALNGRDPRANSAVSANSQSVGTADIPIGPIGPNGTGVNPGERANDDGDRPDPGGVTPPESNPEQPPAGDPENSPKSPDPQPPKLPQPGSVGFGGEDPKGFSEIGGKVDTEGNSIQATEDGATGPPSATDAGVLKEADAERFDFDDLRKISRAGLDATKPELLTDFARRGIRFEPDGNTLIARPRQTLTDEDRVLIRARGPELCAYLRAWSIIERCRAHKVTFKIDKHGDLVCRKPSAMTDESIQAWPTLLASLEAYVEPVFRLVEAGWGADPLRRNKSIPEHLRFG